MIKKKKKRSSTSQLFLRVGMCWMCLLGQISPRSPDYLELLFINMLTLSVTEKAEYWLLSIELPVADT